jgi:hypothetical protein
LGLLPIYSGTTRRSHCPERIGGFWRWIVVRFVEQERRLSDR